MARIRLLPLIVLLALLGAPLPDGHAGKLQEDGRAGVVLEVQGTALVRPAGRDRWTPLGPKSVLFPGDVLRTSARGAHAVEFATGNGKVLVGPGAWVEVTKPDQVRLLRGALEVVGGPDRAIQVQGPADFRADVKGTAWYVTESKGVRTLEEAPKWAQGYRASASDEWMGSLLAKVDGRDVPLAVGYHKVDVEIRDQIARTTVEQSFQNTTGRRMEGVFYFPLPADASISGFGMWIGGELVEADIVERARAREIYEDILRRKKDPGLLEWEGGNLFKARVFPIEPRSEKKIRIRYTQVLPRQGDTWRYRYALRSELLRSKPLRELQLTVRVVSTEPMTEVASPTHDILLHAKKHEATAEFQAQEYSPTKDFELAVTLGATDTVTAIPHRRGEDGYFMLLLAPPDERSGAWTRELAPDGDPLDVVLLADTSGSVDEATRANQAAFLDAFLSLLGEQDRFRLATCDVDVSWLVGKPTQADADNVEAALDALAARPSLGWTDLDRAFAQVGAKTDGKSLVIYVGDAVATTGDADPIAQAERIRALAKQAGATWHAVAPSSSYETPVLEAMSRVGRGSWRTVGEQPARAAFALLAEIARPVLRDVRVEIQGLRTARVYPQDLPNVPAGSQQIVLGRFQPADTPQTGTVVVQGQLAGKPVRYTSTLTIPAADVGNSFLPRLWARKHIDALLQEGGSDEIAEEIIAFSERFGVMTPYTSFLVLESDEDRERYGVKRQVRMRDGERFFADARDKAELERRRDLMRNAGRWRLGMRTQALAEIARLGRDLPIATPPSPMQGDTTVVAYADTRRASTFGGIGGGAGGYDRGLAMTPMLEESKNMDSWGGPMDSAREELQSAGRRLGGRPRSKPAGSPMTGGLPERRSRKGKKSESEMPPAPKSAAPTTPAPAKQPMADDALEALDFEAGGGGRGYVREAEGIVLRQLRGQAFDDRLRYRGGPYAPPPFSLATLGFPPVPAAPRADPQEATPPWNPEVLALLRTLPRRDDVRKAPAGVHVKIVDRSLHPTRNRVRSGSHLEAWLKPGLWWIDAGNEAFAEPRSTFVLPRWRATDDAVRGHVAHARRLARTRDAEPRDVDAWTLPLWDLEVRDAIARWVRQGFVSARIVKEDGTLVDVELRGAEPHPHRLRLRIDRSQRVIVAEDRYDANGTYLRGVRRKAFTEAAGRVWAQTIEYLDQAQRVVRRLQVAIESAGEIEPTLRKRARGVQADDHIVLHGKLPKRADAKQALRMRTARLEDRFALLVDLGRQQRWPVWQETWQATKEVLGKAYGTPWIEAAMLQRARKGEELRKLVGRLVEIDRASGGASRRHLVHWLLHLGNGFGPGERGGVLDAVRFDWIDSPAEGARRRALAWTLARSGAYDAAQQYETAHRMRQEAGRQHPDNLIVQLRVEGDYWSFGERTQASLLLERLLEEREPWLESERDAIYVRLTDRLWQLRRLDRLAATCERWIRTQPRTQNAWQRYVSSLYFQGKTEEADQTLLRWMSAPLDAEPNPATEAARAAAVAIVLGSGWNFHVNRLDRMWHAPLADLARRSARSDRHGDSYAARILGHWRFNRTDAARELREELRQDVLAPGALASLPLERLSRYLTLLQWRRNQIDEPTWRRVVTSLTERWEAAAAASTQDVWAGLVLMMLDAWNQREEAIGFAEKRLAGAETKSRQRTLALDLFNRLLKTPVRDEHNTPARESRVFDLLPRTIDAEASGEQQQAEAAQTVRRLVKTLDRWRYEAAWGSPEERATMTRAELALRKREARATVRKDLSARLAEATRSATGPTQPWLHVEGLAYAVEHGEDLAILTRTARKILSAAWEREDRPLDRLMRERAAVILAYAATRSNADAKLVRSIEGVFQNGITNWDGIHKADPDAIELLDWRAQLFRLLVARDDVPTLTAALDRWIVPGHVESRWRIARGYLFAETGAVGDAVSQFEAVAKLDELEAADYFVLADWLLVLGKDAERRVALDAAYDHLNEYELSNRIGRLSRRRGPGGVPQDADPELYPVLRALMRKASHPQNHWWQLRNLYRQAKDHRALAATADAVTGHTKEATYGFLGRLGSLVNEVHEEATVDEVLRTLRARLTQAERPLDRRGLRLAEARFASRAAKVIERDTTHDGVALAALRAAFQETWQPHERRLMSTYLTSLGRLHGEAAAEQMRQFEALRKAEAPGTTDRLRISLEQAKTWWTYEEKDRAVSILENALAEIRPAHGGQVPYAERNALDTYVNWLSAMGRFASAERVLLAESERWRLPSYRRTLRVRLYQLYVEAVKRKGSVSLGRGAALFTAARDLMEADTLRHPAEARNVLTWLGELHQAAHGAGAIKDAPAQWATYARARLPLLLARVPINATNYLNVVANHLRKLDGPRPALALLMGRIETEPRWLDRMNQDVWNQSAYSIARWRYETGGALGDLERPLLSIVTKQIERNLLELGDRYAPIWRHNHKWFWREQADAFADVPRRLAELHEKEIAVVTRSASFLRSSLNRKRAAIAILQAADARGQLPERNRWTLASWLLQDRRYEEALPICGALAELRPDRLDYRIGTARALQGLKRNDDVMAVLKATETHFRERKLWRENTAAQLGTYAARAGVDAEAERWMEEAIRLRQDARGNRGGADRTLARYYRALATARAGLGKTEAAVQAAATAILSTNPRNASEMGKSRQALDDALAKAKDLSAYVASYEAQVEKTGMDAPLIRKALARRFQAGGEWAKAVHHLEAARELAPGDGAIHRALVAAFDAWQKPEQAIAALYGSIRLAPYALDAYTDLARRYRKAGDEAQAERALTNLVEPAPNQADGHRRLATVRQEQKRWPDAVVQWRQVVRTEPKDPMGALSLARALIQTGETAEARRVLEQVLRTEWAKRHGDPKATATEILKSISG